jgi:hypothetical protein
VGGSSPQWGGGGPFARTGAYLLAMSALMSASAYLLALVAPAACYLQFHRLFYRFVVRRLSALEDRYLCCPFVPSNPRLEDVGRFRADWLPFVGVRQFDSLGGR